MNTKTTTETPESAVGVPRLVRLSRKDEGTLGRIIAREWVMYCLRALGRDGNPARLSDAFAERGRLMVLEELETLLESGWPLDGSVLTKAGLKRIQGIAIDHALGMLRNDERYRVVADHFSKPNATVQR